MTLAFDLNSVAQLLALRIAHSFVDGVVIALSVGGLLLIGRRQLSSAARFALWFSAMMAMAVPAMVGSLGSSPTAGYVAKVHPPLIIPGSWALIIFAAWSVIATILLARVAIAGFHLFRLRRSCVPLDWALADSDLQLRNHGRVRRVELCTSEQVTVPTAVGLIRPAVVLPGWLIKELPPAELRQVVLHELAHLRRWDDWTNLAQQIVKAALFFHPAVWWIERKISLEREMACDEAVVAETANPRAYAECLAHLAEKTMVRRGLALAQAAVGRVHQTSLRVAQLLRGDRPSKHGWVAGGVVIAGFAVVCTAAISRTPELIGFAPDQPQIVATRSMPLPQMGLTKTAIAAAETANTPTLPVLQAAAKLPNTGPMRHEAATAHLKKNFEYVDGKVMAAHWAEPAADPTPAIRGVFFVVESSEYLPSCVVVHRTAVWRIMVVPPASSLNTRIPAKQT